MTTKRVGLELDRLKAFSDGVMAIALTILVLDLDVPDQTVLETGGLVGFLAAIEPQLRPYIASFVSIATFWTVQVVVFHYIDHCDRRFMWLNILFFLPVSLNPFITEMRADHVGNAYLALLYSAVQVAAFVTLACIWYYACTHLRDRPPDRSVTRGFYLRILVAIAFYVLGAAVAPLSERAATLCFLIGPLLFIRHRRFDAEASAG